MKDEMDIQDRKLKTLLVLAVLLGGLSSLLFNPETALTVAGIFDEEIPLYNVYVMEIDRGECRLYTPQKYWPAGAREIQNKSGLECGEPYRVWAMDQKIDVINQSSDDPEVERLINNASTHLEDKNLDRAKTILDRLELERTYTVSD